MNLNKAFIIGNLTRDPELKNLPSGTQVASFGIATNRVWKNQAGAKQEDTQFHNIVVFGRQAETVSQYLKKGAMVFIEGRIQNRTWDAQDGTKKSRSEIVAENIQFGPRTGGATGGGGNFVPRESGFKKDNDGGTKEELATIEYPDDEINPEDIPF